MKIKHLASLAALAIGATLSVMPAMATPINKKTTKHLHKATYKLKPALANVKFKNIEFTFNKATIPAHCYHELDKAASLIVANNASVKLGGYADKTGGYVYNWKLSKSRAESVKTYLVSKGADSSRIAATEYGYTQPIATNKTKAGRKKNRRVEIQFVQ